MTREGLVGYLAKFIDSLQRPDPVRVAIDGPDAAGKTKSADELASNRREFTLAVDAIAFARRHGRY
jgi:hypothetical protein